eukprot:353509-Chlamydomonas_euryale.AAC.2
MGESARLLVGWVGTFPHTPQALVFLQQLHGNPLRPALLKEHVRTQAISCCGPAGGEQEPHARACSCSCGMGVAACLHTSGLLRALAGQQWLAHGGTAQLKRALAPDLTAAPHAATPSPPSRAPQASGGDL